MQGFNKYYPPDYDPKDARHKGNLNRLAGKSAPKPVVRFEMPFNVWCLHCQAHIAQGVRFNAEKKLVGKYFTSPIYSFTMTCHLCAGVIIVTTNPKETTYDVTEGAKKKMEEWHAQDSGTFEFDYRVSDTISDPIYKLEQDATQKLNVKDANQHITQLRDLSDRQWADPYTQSQRLRRTFRAEKKRLRESQQARQDVERAHGLSIDVLDLSSSDVLGAKMVEFDATRNSRTTYRQALTSSGGPAPFKSLQSSSNKPASFSNVDPFSFSTAASITPKRAKDTSSTVDPSSKQLNLVQYDSDDDFSDDA